MKPRLRADLESLGPYLAPQVQAGVRLNTNESPYPLPEGFLPHLVEAIAMIPFHRYPDREASALREALGRHAGHPPDGVWAANGSNEVIQHLCLAFGGPGRRALVFEPTYSLHGLIPRIVGMEVRSDRLDLGFHLSSEAAERAAREHQPAVAFLCSPNNPTGNAQHLNVVEALCAAVDGLVIVDEAYGEFGGLSSQPLLERFENLAVIRTFSKAFALAGARLGYGLAAPEVVKDLARVRLPYHLSALTQTAGLVALRYTRAAGEILDRIRAERDRLYHGLGKMDAVEAFPSRANFVLFRTARPAEQVWQALLDRGILVRDVSWAPGLERCLRVTAGTSEETGAFLRAMDDVMKEET